MLLPQYLNQITSQKENPYGHGLSGARLGETDCDLLPFSSFFRGVKVWRKKNKCSTFVSILRTNVTFFCHFPECPVTSCPTNLVIWDPSHKKRNTCNGHYGLLISVFGLGSQFEIAAY
ncbi:hypothetical protein CEXT_146811 [Caerostris extrusa]|uniref:Uncharacterized protein n=1 Tax=Caerostris extrusa TaxID=172846 RepID=A0AAV4MJI8_CAEEX|nr:hypothetical protein CEXT_146811 [Caerostris extrusa]